jgi:hypothetical protein
VQSLAAEGGLLAGDASRGRSTATFVRVHAAELGKAASASATVLAKGRTPRARALTTLARRTARELERLSQSDSNRAAQRLLAAQLERAAARAERLGNAL